eukprot:scaffold86840_cov33-Tisochrysis_lutea.AAC.4
MSSRAAIDSGTARERANARESDTKHCIPRDGERAPMLPTRNTAAKSDFANARAERGGPLGSDRAAHHFGKEGVDEGGSSFNRQPSQEGDEKAMHLRTAAEGAEMSYVQPQYIGLIALNHLHVASMLQNRLGSVNSAKFRC